MNDNKFTLVLTFFLGVAMISFGAMWWNERQNEIAKALAENGPTAYGLPEFKSPLETQFKNIQIQTHPIQPTFEFGDESN